MWRTGRGRVACLGGLATAVGKVSRDRVEDGLVAGRFLLCHLDLPRGLRASIFRRRRCSPVEHAGWKRQ